MNLEKLSEPLNVAHIDFKIAQVHKTDKAVWAQILAYKDARVDMMVLDEAVGRMNWQVKYERDSKGVLQCAVGIWDETKSMGSGDWVWKTSNGVESDYESEKGEYSDAFKRACFLWGIGRQLYNFPTIRVQLTESDYHEVDGKIKVKAWVKPSEWNWYISEDYQKIKCERKFGNKWVMIFNNHPYDKEDE